jgi:DNA-binding MarR family transcriptional regulator
MPREARGRQELLDAVDHAMREVGALGVRYSRAVAARLGINDTDLACLDLVLSGRGVTAGALAEATGLTTGAITGVVDRLEEAGLVRRRRDAADRRRVIVVATPLAQERAAPLAAPMRGAVLGALSRYGDPDLKLVHRVLGEVGAAAKDAVAALDDGDRRPARRTVRPPSGSSG